MVAKMAEVGPRVAPAVGRVRVAVVEAQRAVVRVVEAQRVVVRVVEAQRAVVRVVPEAEQA